MSGNLDMVSINETIECNAIAFPKARITWRQESSPDPKVNRKLLIHLNKIVITVFDPPGVYSVICEARNKHGQRRLAHQFMINNPRYIRQGTQFSIYILVLICIVALFSFTVCGYFLTTYDFCIQPRVCDEYLAQKSDILAQ
ncbi:unnamed protein product [Protopolystoma xenopodis]|uniref:Ig-like domain-containing protein n=1 Tax=Protopolystoma xenopodis TaxID=117903 RepID=A0A3S5A6I6_9PLAT|nr:unnamed protein product [Protopolystoma xenopodis]